MTSAMISAKVVLLNFDYELWGLEDKPQRFINFPKFKHGCH